VKEADEPTAIKREAWRDVAPQQVLRWLTPAAGQRDARHPIGARTFHSPHWTAVKDGQVTPALKARHQPETEAVDPELSDVMKARMGALKSMRSLVRRNIASWWSARDAGFPCLGSKRIVVAQIRAAFPIPPRTPTRPATWQILPLKAVSTMSLSSLIWSMAELLRGDYKQAGRWRLERGRTPR
jgi:hypothetical protein